MTKCISAGIQAESVTSAAGTVNVKKKNFPVLSPPVLIIKASKTKDTLEQTRLYTGLT